MTSYDEQILQTVQAQLERMERRLQRIEMNDIWVPGIYIAQTGASGVPALSGSTPGSAEVTLRRLNSSGTIENLTSRTGGNVTVTAYNMASTAVGANIDIHIKQERASGAYLVDFEDCG